MENEVRMIITDLDNSLLNSKRQISKYTINVFKKWSVSDTLCKWKNIIRTEPVLFQTQWQTGLELAPNF
jgi:hypothetical protein